MTLPEEAGKLIAEEEEILRTVIYSLANQSHASAQRLHTEAARARQLTSEIVSARRDVEKQMLASDEAVAHQLTKHARSSVKGLEKMLSKPYFARIVLQEEDGGRTKEIEYKLGFAANTDCRIIDWRKAPIARLYYEYQQGDEYAELIQGRERSGCIKLRHKLDIEHGELKGFSSPIGSYVKAGSGWKAAKQNGAADLSPHGALPDVLSLITADQFQLITEDAQTAVLIQGIAGSGKTTVALHRLAWLLHEENSSLSPAQCLVLVMTKALQTYIAATLERFGITEVLVCTFREWTTGVLRKILKSGLERPAENAGPAERRVKRSSAMLLGLEDFARRHTEEVAQKTPQECLLSLFAKPDLILKHDDTRLLDHELIRTAAAHSTARFNAGYVDYADDPLIIRLHQLRTGGVILPNGSPGKFGHIVADEAQELSSVDLAAIIGSVEKPSQLTLVGDTEQEIYQSSAFLGWEKLRERLTSDEESSANFTALTVSHRSTLPIMRFADHISGKKRTTHGRKGKPPLWLACGDEDQGVTQVLGWIQRVLTRYPNTVVAVICSKPADARYAAGLLRPSFGSAVRLGDDDSFAFGEGIVVSSVDQVKGLEFANVLIWNPADQAYPPTSEGRHLLYVAVTRAQQNLCLVTWDRCSALLPPITSKLVRGHNLTEQE